MNSYFYVAKVTDNKDEDNLNRVKVTTHLKEDTVSYWVPYLSCNAGEGIGFSSLPEIDDQVLVLSFGSSRENQIVIGSFWNSNCKPPETKENTDADLNGDGKNNLSFFKSKKESMVIFDDTDSKEKMQFIVSGGKSRIELDNENELINIETDKDFNMSAKGAVSIKTEKEFTVSAKKACHFKCDNFGAKASKGANVEASKDLTVKGSGIALN